MTQNENYNYELLKYTNSGDTQHGDKDRVVGYGALRLYKNSEEFFLTQDEKNKVDKFYDDNNYNLPTYNMMSNPSPEINTRTLPTTFIIDKNGKLALKEVGASNWNSSSVRKMLDNLIAE